MASFQDAIVEEAETSPVAAAAVHEDTEKRKETTSNHAQQVQLRLERCLRHLGLTPFSSKFIMQFITTNLCKAETEGDDNPFLHVLPYLLQLLQPKPRVETPGIDRKGCPQIIPGLRSMPFWDASQFPWAAALESHVDVIREEFLSLRDSLAGFQRYRSSDDSETTDRGHWHVCYLSLHGMDFSENSRMCPRTMEILGSIPRFYHHALFSALDSSTHVTAHYGPTNKKLRCFLPLFVPTDGHGESSCWIRVNHETRRVEEGKVLIFDDSFYHEAANDSPSSPRIVLIIDVWHPDLTDLEVKTLEFINKAQISAAKRLAKAMESSEVEREGTSDGSFITTITANKQVGITEEDAVRIWGEYMRER